MTYSINMERSNQDRDETQEMLGNYLGILQMEKQMAKKAKVTTVTVADLAEEYGMEGRKIRMLIRGSGRKAPEVKDAEGFGPRAKYEWKSNSKELKEVRALITEAQKKESSKPAKKKSKKKGKEEPTPKPEDDEEEDDDEEEEDDEEEDEDDD